MKVVKMHVNVLCMSERSGVKSVCRCREYDIQVNTGNGQLN